jgi:2Fe-2S ferredoxin
VSTILATTADGHLIEVPARTGDSVMQALRDADVEGILALCAGCCSCATCHVYVDDAWLSKVGAANPAENELLEAGGHRRRGSRLSCQIEMIAALDGLRIEIAPQDM